MTDNTYVDLVVMAVLFAAGVGVGYLLFRGRRAPTYAELYDAFKTDVFTRDDVGRHENEQLGTYDTGCRLCRYMRHRPGAPPISADSDTSHQQARR